MDGRGKYTRRIMKDSKGDAEKCRITTDIIQNKDEYEQNKNN